jgi:NAD-dependent SIR2 family protein deacetylase
MKTKKGQDVSVAPQIVTWLKQADRVLIGAGAGLSASAGFDYTDAVRFAELFPALTRRGFQARYQLIGYEGWNPEEKWAYWAKHVEDVRFSPGSHPVYTRLFDLVKDKDYFVLTSNVDALFARNGFDEERLYTPQGDYGQMQCRTPCRQVTWPSKPILDCILAHTDAESEVVNDLRVIPTCPFCGEDVFLNVRLDHGFVETPYKEQSRRFRAWFGDGLQSSLLVLEIGAGYSTPSVVRWPMENIVFTNPNARFVRINLSHPEVPGEIAKRSISLAMDAQAAVDAIWDANVASR